VITFPDFSLRKNFTLRAWSLNEDALQTVLNEYYKYGAVGNVPEGSKKVKEVTTSPSKVESGRGVSLGLGKGVYLLETDSPELAAKMYWVISYSTWAVGTVTNNDGFGVWSFSTDSKNPVSGINIELWDCGNSCAKIGSGSTNSSGYWASSAVTDAQREKLAFIAKKDGQFTVVLNNDRWYSPFYFGGSYGGGLTTQILFDSPLYKFGDTVRYAVVARSYNPRTGSYRIPQGKVELVVNHLDDSGQYSRISTQEREFNNYGIVHGETKLPLAQQSGEYVLSVRDPVSGEDLANQYITLGTMAPSQYSAQLRTDKTKYFNGETINVSGQVTDYAGGVVANQKVKLVIYQNAASGNDWRESDQEVEYYEAYSEDAKTVTLTTDSEGRLTYSHKAETWDGSTLDVIAFELTDARNNTLETTAAAIAAQQTDVFVRPFRNGPISDTLAVGDQIDLQFASRSLWGYQPKGKVTFRFLVTRYWTEQVQVGTEYDPDLDANVPVYEMQGQNEVFVSQQEKVTNDNGVVQVSLPALKEGRYQVSIEIIDGSKVTVKNTDSIFSAWAQGEDTDDDNVYLSYDGGDAAPDEKVSIKINSTLTNAQQKAVLALVGRKVWHSEVITPETKGSYDFTVTNDHFPSVDVCVLYLTNYTEADLDFGNRLEIDCEVVKVSADRYKLQVSVTPDKDTYKPGEEARINVQVRDHEGKPVKAQVILRGVDQSLLDSVDSYEFKQQMIDSFYAYLYSYDPFEQSHSRYELSPAGGMGAGGGDVGTARTNFNMVSLWAPQVETDSNGNAQTTLRWPDSVTSWRVQADAVTANNEFGTTSKNVITTQSQYILWEPVTHIATGDSWQATMRVVNREKNAFNGQLSVQCTGCQQGQYSFPVQISGNSSKTVSMKVQVAGAAGSTLKFTNTLSTSTNQTVDQIERSLTIGTGGKIVNSGLVTKTLDTDHDQLLYDVELPKDLTGAEPKMQLALTKGFFIDYLDQEPNFTIRSTQQLAQYLFYSTIVYSHYDQLQPANLSKEELASRIAFVTELLEANQKADGGFGQFTYDTSRTDSSLLVGLAVAQAPGMAGPINTTALQRYILTVLDTNSTNIYDKTMALYVLSLFKNQDGLRYASYLTSHVSEFSDQVISLGYLSAALANYGSTGDVQTVNNLIKTKVNQGDDFAYWQDIKTNQRQTFNDKYVTAVVYLGLAGSNRDQTAVDLMDKTAGWLTGGSNDSASITFTQLMEFYALFTVDTRDVTNQAIPVSVFVNNQKVGEYQVSGVVRVEVDAKYLQPRQNAIRIERGKKHKIAVQTRYQYAATTLDSSKGNVFSIDRKVMTVSGKSVSKVTAGNSYRVDVTVRPSQDVDNVVVVDSLPGGVEPANLFYSNLSLEVLDDFWVRVDNNQILVPQSPATVGTFVSSMKAGKTYTFSYLVTAMQAGNWQTPATYAYSSLFNELNSARTNSALTIAPR